MVLRGPDAGGQRLPDAQLRPEGGDELRYRLGARYRDHRLSLEAFVFRNEIRDGIRIASADTTIDGLPGLRNVNVDELRYRGIGRFNARWWVRHQGDQKDVDLGTNPVGEVLPAFTVHSAAAAITLFAATGHAQRLALTVHNLGDVLYSETSNASFFRPEPGRTVRRMTLARASRFVRGAQPNQSRRARRRMGEPGGRICCQQKTTRPRVAEKLNRYPGGRVGESALELPAAASSTSESRRLPASAGRWMLP
jgi:hypothetical protein